MTLFGIDAEGRLDRWPSAYSFGIFRAVREFGTVDADFLTNVSRARLAGAIPGAYHYIGHGRPIRDDVKRLVEIVDLAGGSEGMLISPDIEDAGLTYAEIETWFDEFRRHLPNHPLLLYTYEYFWERNYGTRSAAKFTPYLWAANPRTGTYQGDSSSGWTQRFGGYAGPVMWQYRGTTDIGIGAAVDLNAFRGTRAELLALTTSIPETSTEEPMLDFYITGDPGGFARSLTGKLWRMANGVLQPVEPTRSFPVTAEVELRQPLPGFETAEGDYKSAYLVSGSIGVPYFLLRKDAAYAAPVQPVDLTPYDADDITAARRSEYDRVRSGITFPTRP
jgi:hypothetical protein